MLSYMYVLTQHIYHSDGRIYVNGGSELSKISLDITSGS